MDDDFTGGGLSIPISGGVSYGTINEPAVIGQPSSAQQAATGVLGSLGSVLGGPLGGIAGSIIGGMFGKSAAKKQQADAYAQAWQQNLWNAGQQDKQFAQSQLSASTAREFSHNEAELNRQFQERMSGTAHQREVADLSAAGLNPILSVSKGGPGSSTPGGSMASSSMATSALTAPAASAAVPDYGASSARGAEVGRALTVGIAQAIADLELKGAQTSEVLARANNVRADTWLKARLGGLTEAQTSSESYKQSDLRAGADLKDAQRLMIPYEKDFLEARASESGQSARKLRVEADVSSSDAGYLAEYLKRYSQLVPGFGILLRK